VAVDFIEFALLGLATGAIYGLIAHSVVAVNVGSGVLDFSAGAFGLVAALAFYEHRGHGFLGNCYGFVLALGIAGTMGATAHMVIMRRLANAPPTSRIFASLGLMSAIFTGEALFTKNKGATVFVDSPLPGGHLQIGSRIDIGWDRLTVAGISVVITILLVLAQKYTRLGLASSAVAENRFVAATMGWSPDAIGAITWAVGAMVAAVGAILFAALAELSPQNVTFLVIPSLAAALIGSFRSFVWTFIGALAIGVTQSELAFYVHSPGWSTATPLLAIIAVLAFRGTSLPQKTEASERRPTVGSGRLRWGTSLLIPAIVFVGALQLTTAWIAAFSVTFIFALIILSIVVVTGYSGQLSLAQMTMAALGAWFTSLIAIETGMPLILAMILGVVACVPVAMLVAVPAFRTRGHVLAVSTLGLATAIDALVINNPDTQLITEGKPLGTFSLFGYDLSGLTNPTRFALATFVVFVAAAVGVANLRRGRVGRRLLAVRANELAAASLGISVVATKVYAFSLAAMIAGLAGAMTEARFGVGDVSTFPLLENINIVLAAVIGGLGWIATSVFGALGIPGGLSQQAVQTAIPNAGLWFLFIGGVGAIIIVMQAPNGILPFKLAAVKALGRHATGTFKRVLRREDEVVGESSLPPASGARHIIRVQKTSLEVAGITVRFGDQAALSDAGYVLNTGEIVGLIGANGAGKSTMIDVTTGFRRPNAGSVLLDGTPIDRLSAAQRARSRIVRTFQNPELFDDMTVLENLRVGTERTRWHHYATDLAWPRRSRLTDETEVAIQELRLEPVLHRLPTELDYGKRRLVAIARALSMAPSLLLLDEPAAGLDGIERRELGHLIGRLAREWGIGVLLVEHDVQLVFSVCERVVALDFGRVIAEGSVQQVRNDPAVRAAYLGEEEEPQPAEVAVR
jgi:sulfate-transporting ATPase